ncbi:MAG: hypothetical protein AAF633_22395 [Chloroflexota bacterium]
MNQLKRMIVGLALGIMLAVGGLGGLSALASQTANEAVATEVDVIEVDAIEVAFENNSDDDDGIQPRRNYSTQRGRGWSY